MPPGDSQRGGVRVQVGDVRARARCVGCMRLTTVTAMRWASEYREVAIRWLCRFCTQRYVTMGYIRASD